MRGDVNMKLGHKEEAIKDYSFYIDTFDQFHASMKADKNIPNFTIPNLGEFYLQALMKRTAVFQHLGR